MKKLFMLNVVLVPLLCSGCAAKKLESEGLAVKMTHEKPTGDCRELGEVIGTQGNWLTGGYTSNKNLIEGSMNDMRNQAGKMGGDTVWIHQNQTNTGANGNTVNAVTVGTVFQCK